MEATKRLLRQYQNAAINLRKVADEMEKVTMNAELVQASRGKALIYETVANELALALLEDKVPLNHKEEGN